MLCVATNGFAQVEITMPGNLTAGPGDEVVVPLSLDDAAGVLGYFFEIEMDGSVVEFVGAENGGLTAGWGAPTVNAEADRVSIINIDAVALSGQGTLASLTFRVKSTASNGDFSPLTFATAELNDGAIAATTTNGRIDVSRTVLVSAAVSPIHSPGDTVTVAITLDDGGGVLGYFFDLTYDDAILEYLGFNAGSLTATWGSPTINPQPGQITAAGFNATPLDGAGSVLELSFRLNNNAPFDTTTTLTLTTAELNDGAIPSSTANGSITIADPNTVPITRWACILQIIVLLSVSTLVITRGFFKTYGHP
jgi:hypothetical protein